MAKKIEAISEIETKEKPSLFDLIDDEITEESKVEIEAKKALFEHDHKTKDLQETYDEIDEQDLEKGVRDNEYQQIERLDTLYGSKEDFIALRNRQRRKQQKIKNDEKPSITLEITPTKKEKEKTKNPKISKARRILWTSVISVCAVVLFSLCIYNTVKIVDSANKLSQTEQALQTETSQLSQNQYTYQQMVDELGQSTTQITDGMVVAGEGTKVSLEPIVEVANPVPPTSFFDKLCSFFAKLFGR